MTLQSASTAPAVAPLGTRSVLLAGLLLLGAALSQVTLAASDASGDCERLEISLRSLDVPVAEFPADAEADGTAAEAPLAGPSPILRLTPRVATIMREVFDALPIVMLDENGDEVDAQPVAEEPRKAPVGAAPVVNAPLLGQDEIAEVPLPKMRDEVLDNRFYMPRFQRHMYRTDI